MTGLGSLIEHVGIFKQLLDLHTSSVLCVSDLATYLYVEWSPDFDLGVRPGDQVKSGSVLADAMACGKPVRRTMDKSLYGVPYIAMAVPIFAEGRVCGGIVCCISTEQQEKISSSAEELSAMTEELSATAETFARNAESLAGANMGIVALAKTLDEQMHAIEHVNQVIAQLARQTNLLGLNASIEAAHAGQYGRGFSVVANEVRRLANQSQTSASEVRENVASVLESAKNLLAQAEAIASAAQEQAAGAQELAAVVQQINRLTGILSDLAR
ncbi:methyl-accepting chemotaxis protein [Effusibacillus pohliae]|uniref:methyl-accepting chemotaxis protein n=1 Tax=Effusibacillus pohliae TaxID=232270 RepID=UPI00037F809B|nr:methyl-accepting chemotaxis protein [Effusibacillus pohliae]